MTDDTQTSTVTIQRDTAIIAMRAMSEQWGQHEGHDDDVLEAIHELERVTGVTLDLKSRQPRPPLNVNRE